MWYHEIHHSRRKVLNIGGPRFRILGGGGKLFAGCNLIGAPAPNQCRIITLLTLKTGNKAKLRIELKSILLEIPSNKIKGTYIKFAPASSYAYVHEFTNSIDLDEVAHNVCALVFEFSI